MSAAGEPLAGCVMIVTADRRRAELATALARRGASVTFAPALSTVSHLGDDTLLATTRRRRGSAASVERTAPVAYSPVTTSTPSTAIASCAIG